ncbi:MAG: hypothetical protein NZ774_00080 [Candidatus Poseidoniales archaeon]|nr:hypothetical protein [Candidatus Poseidoniales archaeon]
MSSPFAVVCTTIRPSDHAPSVADSLRTLFPELEPPEFHENEFPVTEKVVEWKFEDVDLSRFLERISELRILDTALDAMGANLYDNETIFSLSRQAALVSKVAFVLNDEKSLGGTIDVTIRGDNLAAWIEESTWHEGRIEYPRSLSDDWSMHKDGEVSEWIDGNSDS